MEQFSSQANESGTEQEIPLNTPEASERKNVLDNPRIQALMNTLQDAEKKLKEAIADVETRESTPEFQKAQELYDQGWRVECTFLDHEDEQRLLIYNVNETGADEAYENLSNLHRVWYSTDRQEIKFQGSPEAKEKSELLNTVFQESNPDLILVHMNNLRQES